MPWWSVLDPLAGLDCTIDYHSTNIGLRGDIIVLSLLSVQQGTFAVQSSIKNAIHQKKVTFFKKFKKSFKLTQISEYYLRFPFDIALYQGTVYCKYSSLLCKDVGIKNWFANPFNPIFCHR